MHLDGLVELGFSCLLDEVNSLCRIVLDGPVNQLGQLLISLASFHCLSLLQAP
jgi:hypothetical protein